MKIYILRYGGDENAVMAFSSKAKRKKEKAEITKNFGPSFDDLDFEEIDCTVTPTRSGIIRFFNFHAWHNQ